MLLYRFESILLIKAQLKPKILYERPSINNFNIPAHLLHSNVLLSVIDPVRLRGDLQKMRHPIKASGPARLPLPSALLRIAGADPNVGPNRHNIKDPLRHFWRHTNLLQVDRGRQSIERGICVRNSQELLDELQ